MTTKDPLKFDDTDFKLTKLIAVGVTAAAAVITIVAPIVQWATGQPLVVGLEGVAEGAVDGARPGVTLTHGAAFIAEFANPSAGQWLASLVPNVIFTALMAVVTWLLWGLLDGVRDGRPFTHANVGRLRAIAIVIIAGAAMLFVAQGLVNGYLHSSAVEGASVVFLNDSSASDLLLPGVGFLLAALAQAFRRGVELEEDVEGLV